MTNASILSILVEVHYYAPAKVTGAGAYCGGHLAAQLVFFVFFFVSRYDEQCEWFVDVDSASGPGSPCQRLQLQEAQLPGSQGSW